MGKQSVSRKMPSWPVRRRRNTVHGGAERLVCDPADPDAAERYNSNNKDFLQDQATAFLAAHEALLDGGEEPEDELDPPMELAAPGTSQPVWIGLPFQQDFDDEGELGWQTDALCAQTDPEAFFPEKGGSTRDAKKVCGACNVPVAMP
jgi:WhiB family redox-sensing transcriptional regulator